MNRYPGVTDAANERDFVAVVQDGDGACHCLGFDHHPKRFEILAPCYAYPIHVRVWQVISREKREIKPLENWAHDLNGALRGSEGRLTW